MRIDGDRDVSKLIVSFRNRVNALKIDDFYEAQNYDVDSKIM